MAHSEKPGSTELDLLELLVEAEEEGPQRDTIPAPPVQSSNPLADLRAQLDRMTEERDRYKAEAGELRLVNQGLARVPRYAPSLSAKDWHVFKDKAEAEAVSRSYEARQAEMCSLVPVTGNQGNDVVGYMVNVECGRTGEWLGNLELY